MVGSSIGRMVVGSSSVAQLLSLWDIAEPAVVVVVVLLLLNPAAASKTVYK